MEKEYQSSESLACSPEVWNNGTPEQRKKYIEIFVNKLGIEQAKESLEKEIKLASQYPLGSEEVRMCKEQLKLVITFY